MDDDLLLRYNSSIMLPEIDIKGQQKLTQSKVVIMGLGGLGSPVALYLSSTGIGNLTFVDFDKVDITNLQRQIIHSTDDIKKNKTISAREQALKINPDIKINCIDKKLNPQELNNLFKTADIVVDCTDNFASRFAINAACVQSKTPLVSAAAIRFEAQISVYRADLPNSACYNCLYAISKDERENCAEQGIIPPLVGIMGSMQALEVIKVLLNIGKSLQNKLLIFDAKNTNFRVMNLKKDENCPTCGNN
ncbi:MAG: molybdopterin-synthase adenylyltransferase MoeB [Gammaproteobacteria bacterium]|nr:MAG: molybdopterin-synthase adenylyltransferase MoeB [Gammaproteobacteria bacterium]